MEVTYNRKAFHYQLNEDGRNADKVWENVWHSEAQNGNHRHLGREGGKTCGSDTTKLTSCAANNQCYQIFVPIIWLLFFVGIDLTRIRHSPSVSPASTGGGFSTSVRESSETVDSAGGRCVGAFYKVLSRLVTLLLLIGIISWHVWDLVERKPSLLQPGICTQVTALVIYINALFGYLLFLIKGKTVRELQFEMIDFCGTVVNDNDKWYRRTRIEMILLVSIQQIIAFGLIIYIICENEYIQDYYNDDDDDDLLPITRNSSNPVSQRYLAFGLFVNVTGVVVLNIHVSLVVYYLVLSLVMIKSFTCTTDALDHGMQQRGRLRSNAPIAHKMAAMISDAIATFIRRHQRLCLSVERADFAFSEMVAVWLLTELTCVVFRIRGLDLVSGGNGDDDDGLGISSETIIIVFLLCFVFILKSLSAASINDHVMSSLTKITAMDECAIMKFTGQDFLKYSADELKCQLYIQYVNVDAPVLTGWGLFVIQKGFILAAAGNVLTYVLVLYNIK